jgi:hypothetical protein
MKESVKQTLNQLVSSYGDINKLALTSGITREEAIQALAEVDVDSAEYYVLGLIAVQAPEVAPVEATAKTSKAKSADSAA